MAGTPERAIELMEAVWPAAIARVSEEVADMQAIADKEGANIKIAPWDYRYYAEKVRKDKYDLDSDEVKAVVSRSLCPPRQALWRMGNKLPRSHDL